MYLAQVMNRDERATAALEGLAKSRAKFAIEVRINERIKSAVEVANPEHDRHYHIAAFARGAKRRNDVPASMENRYSLN